MDWKKIVGTVGPALATALGGPLAGVAVKQIGNALLGKPDAKEDEVAAAVAGATPADLIKLRELDQQFAEQMANAGIRLEEIAAADRASARAREITAHDSWTPRILAGVIVGGFLATCYMVLTGYVAGLKDPMVSGIVGTLIGYVSAKADTVISYYFGSSSSSRAKDDVIGRAVL